LGPGATHAVAATFDGAALVALAGPRAFGARGASFTALAVLVDPATLAVLVVAATFDGAALEALAVALALAALGAPTVRAGRLVGAGEPISGPAPLPLGGGHGALEGDLVGPSTQRLSAALPTQTAAATMAARRAARKTHLSTRSR
jgi:hypothetical protein